MEAKALVQQKVFCYSAKLFPHPFKKIPILAQNEVARVNSEFAKYLQLATSSWYHQSRKYCEKLDLA